MVYDYGMKIEKISENQICCTLTLADLMNNKIHLGDLAGNSDRVRNFFNYLMQRAKRDCGFEFESGPLIIEAIHQPPDSLKLVITKANESGEFDEGPAHGAGANFFDPAADIADIIKKSMNKAKAAMNEKAKEAPAEENEPEVPGIPSAFRFSSLENVILASKAVSQVPVVRNSLFRDTTPGFYLIILDAEAALDRKYEALVNILSEYSQPSRISASSESYLEEHDLLMVKDNALDVMSGF